MEQMALLPVAAFYQPEGETWEEMTRWLFAQEEKCRADIDHISRLLATTLQLPTPLSPKERFYLGYRMMCALDFLGMAFPPEAKHSPLGEVPESWTDSKAIEWLLVDLWRRRCDHWLKLSAIGARGPFAFYGLTPAQPR